MASNPVVSLYGPKTEAEIAALMGQFYADPYGFVLAAYPWGQPLTFDGLPNPLAKKDGPEEWQRDLLINVGKHVEDNLIRDELELEQVAWSSAVASGHGVGKSAIVAWLVQWFMSTRIDVRGVVTASTQFQLEDKTWPELQKWHNLLINKHWFVWRATTYSFAAYVDEEKQKTYRFTAATVSEQKTEAFAGLHNEGKAVVVVFDEASGIPSKIWEVASGVMTDGEGFFLAFGNPTNPVGEFADCFGKNANFYPYRRHIDSRSVRHTNKGELQKIIDKYGAESDQAKVRVYGLFPEHAMNGFMEADAVRAAMNREEVVRDSSAALIMSVDVGHDGDDSSVIGFRQGWDARSFPREKIAKMKTTRLVERICVLANQYLPDIIVVECIGPGVGVCDQLEDLGWKVYRAYPGTPVEVDYVNLRAKWWSKMRDWIYEPISAICNSTDLFDQLTKIQYALRRSDGKTLMESKKEMKDRGVPSPDDADQLMLTFAVDVPRRDRNLNKNANRRTRMSKTEADPLPA